MGTPSQERVQRIKDMLTRDVTERELNEIRELLPTIKRGNNDGCGFLKLPAEIRNRIYHYVAADAHAAAATATATEYDLKKMGYPFAVRDSSGKKVRPGIFGICRQLFTEFHSIFYSPVFLKAHLWRNGNCEIVKNSALLDAIVNHKHGVRSLLHSERREKVERDAKAWADMSTISFGAQEVARADGPIFLSFWVQNGSPPWVDDFLVDEEGWSLIYDCRTQARSRLLVERASRCALCLISMGPERAAIAGRWYV